MSKQEGMENELADRVDFLASELAELRQEVQAKDDRIDQLEQQVEKLHADTKLANKASNARRLKKEERAALLLQTATNKLQRDGVGAVSIDVNDADDIFNGELGRQLRYDAMKEAAKAVDGDDVEYVQESRSSDRNTRLVVRSNGHADAIADRFMGGATNAV